jgi:hypothetical protein
MYFLVVFHSNNLTDKNLNVKIFLDKILTKLSQWLWYKHPGSGKKQLEVNHSTKTLNYMVLIFFGFVGMLNAGGHYGKKNPGYHGMKNIVDTAASAGSFNTLVAAVEAADLVDTLNGEGPFTVFVPTDAAFSKLPPTDSLQATGYCFKNSTKLSYTTRLL